MDHALPECGEAPPHPLKHIRSFHQNLSAGNSVPFAAEAATAPRQRAFSRPLFPQHAQIFRPAPTLKLTFSSARRHPAVPPAVRDARSRTWRTCLKSAFSWYPFNVEPPPYPTSIRGAYTRRVSSLGSALTRNVFRLRYFFRSSDFQSTARSQNYVREKQVRMNSPTQQCSRAAAAIHRGVSRNHPLFLFFARRS